MKVLASAALALLVVLSGCKKSSEAAPAPAAPAKASPAPAAPAKAAAPESPPAPAPGGKDAVVFAAGKVADEKAVKSVAARIAEHGCDYDPGSEELRGLDAEQRENPRAAEYVHDLDCAPEDEFDQNCAPDSCWNALDQCRLGCGSTCVSCKEQCQPACDTCMESCQTPECKLKCGEAIEKCLTSCFAPRKSCRDGCQETYETCSEKAAEHWEKVCEAPCDAHVKCRDECKPESGDAPAEECMKKCPDLPSECLENCAQRF
ncbi:hypothetical protein P2318_03280 [Myxococcaceae bacterium GXIMD 01537]